MVIADTGTSEGVAGTGLDERRKTSLRDLATFLGVPADAAPEVLVRTIVGRVRTAELVGPCRECPSCAEVEKLAEKIMSLRELVGDTWLALGGEERYERMWKLRARIGAEVVALPKGINA
jgi:hypothetical protein